MAKCKYCDKDGLTWNQNPETARFFLVEPTGSKHLCQNFNKVPQQQQQQQQQPVQQQTRYDTSYLIPRDDWDKLMGNIAAINFQIGRIAEYYGDLVEHLRVTHNQQITSQNEKEIAEAAYDQDREEGFKFD